LTLQVVVSIMEPTKTRGRKDLKDIEDKPGFRSSGDVTPSGVLPDVDAPKRRFRYGL
jgi:hypothetical protein